MLFPLLRAGDPYRRACTVDSFKEIRDRVFSEGGNKVKLLSSVRRMQPDPPPIPVFATGCTRQPSRHSRLSRSLLSQNELGDVESNALALRPFRGSRAYFDFNTVPTDPSTATVNLTLELLLFKVGGRAYAGQRRARYLGVQQACRRPARLFSSFSCRVARWRRRWTAPARTSLLLATTRAGSPTFLMWSTTGGCGPT